MFFTVFTFQSFIYWLYTAGISVFVFCVPTLTVITVVPVQMFQVDVQKAKADQGFGRRGGRGGYDGGRGYGGRGGEIDLTVVHDDYKCRLNNKTNVFVVF